MPVKSTNQPGPYRDAVFATKPLVVALRGNPGSRGSLIATPNGVSVRMAKMGATRWELASFRAILRKLDQTRAALFSPAQKTIKPAPVKSEIKNPPITDHGR